MEARLSRRGLLAVAAFVPICAAGTLWFPGRRASREYRETHAASGVAAAVVPGSLLDARKRLDAGDAAEEVALRLGKPSMAVATEGREAVREVWTYDFHDGSLQVNITDGRVQHVSTRFEPQHVPAPARTE